MTKEDLKREMLHDMQNLAEKIEKCFPQDESLYEKSKKKVAAQVSEQEMLCQCAEECAELTQAALKMKRCTDESPVDGTRAKLYNNLMEEAADVLCTIDMLAMARVISMEVVDNRKRWKTIRWAERLENAHGGGE